MVSIEGIREALSCTVLCLVYGDSDYGGSTRIVDCETTEGCVYTNGDVHIANSLWLGGCSIGQGPIGCDIPIIRVAGNLHVVNSVFSDMIAGLGVIELYCPYNEVASPSARILSSTFINTTGGLFVGECGEAEIGNTVFAGTAMQGGGRSGGYCSRIPGYETDIRLHGPAVSLGGNYLENGTYRTNFIAHPTDTIGSDGNLLDARLEPVPPFRPLADSPLRDAGIIGMLDPTDRIFDAWGAPRIQNGVIDIGATEVGDEPPMCGGDRHSADTLWSQTVSLAELMRVIQFFNVGVFSCDETSEDGYTPGVGATDCCTHNSDYNPQDWRVDLSELLRLVQLFNVGTFRPCETGEDGFCIETADQ